MSHTRFDEFRNFAPYVAALLLASAAGGQQLTLEYSGGSQKIVVPAGTPIVTNTPADRSFLKPGEYIWTAAQIGTTAR